MRITRLGFPAVPLFGMVLLGVGPAAGPARGQAIGLQPVVTPFPNGVSLNATPVVTADRRYVRLGLQPQFTAIRGVNSFSFGAGAVSGGGFGGFGGFGGGGPGAGGLGNQGGGGALGLNNGSNSGVAIIPGLAAVGSGWGYPAYGTGYAPAYGYGYGYDYVTAAGSYGSSLPQYGGFGYNPYGYSPGGFIYRPRPRTVNAMGNLMQAIAPILDRP